MIYIKEQNKFVFNPFFKPDGLTPCDPKSEYGFSLWGNGLEIYCARPNETCIVCLHFQSINTLPNTWVGVTISERDWSGVTLASHRLIHPVDVEKLLQRKYVIQYGRFYGNQKPVIVAGQDLYNGLQLSSNELLQIEKLEAGEKWEGDYERDFRIMPC